MYSTNYKAEALSALKAAYAAISDLDTLGAQKIPGLQVALQSAIETIDPSYADAAFGEKEVV